MRSMRKKINFRVHLRDRMKEKEFILARMTSYDNRTTKMTRRDLVSE